MCIIIIIWKSLSFNTFIYLTISSHLLFLNKCYLIYLHVVVRLEIV